MTKQHNTVSFQGADFRANLNMVLTSSNLTS